VPGFKEEKGYLEVKSFKGGRPGRRGPGKQEESAQLHRNKWKGVGQGGRISACDFKGSKEAERKSAGGKKLGGGTGMYNI